MHHSCRANHSNHLRNGSIRRCLRLTLRSGVRWPTTWGSFGVQSRLAQMVLRWDSNRTGAYRLARLPPAANHLEVRQPGQGWAGADQYPPVPVRPAGSGCCRCRRAGLRCPQKRTRRAHRLGESVSMPPPRADPGACFAGYHCRVRASATAARFTDTDHGRPWCRARRLPASSTTLGNDQSAGAVPTTGIGATRKAVHISGWGSPGRYGGSGRPRRTRRHTPRSCAPPCRAERTRGMARPWRFRAELGLLAAMPR